MSLIYRAIYFYESGDLIYQYNVGTVHHLAQKWNLVSLRKRFLSEQFNFTGICFYFLWRLVSSGVYFCCFLFSCYVHLEIYTSLLWPTC